MSIFQRYIQHAPVATTGRTALVDDGLPLGAGRMAILANNAMHLAEQNPLRTVRQHPGLLGFYGSSSRGTGFTGTPTTNDIRWDLSPKDGGCCIDLGLHYVWTLPSGQLPKVVLRFSAKVDTGHTLGWVFALTAGQAGPLVAALQTGGTLTSSSWTTEDATLYPEASHVRPLDYTPTNGIDEADVDEGGRLRCFRAFLGAYNSSGTGGAGNVASIAGITLGLEAR